VSAPALPPFEHVVQEHGPTVRRVCGAIVGITDADDVWVETFIAAMRAYPSLPPGSNVRGWLVTIAHNRGIDHVRSAARRPVPTAAVPDQPLPAAFEPDAELHTALSGLAPKQHDAVVYRYLADLPYPEVARLLDITEAAARRNASDGIAKLRTLLRTPLQGDDR
jgi:RNA polymerase sigma factor (sigma-70 family)